MTNNLDNRKKAVLLTTIDTYIKEAEPVGSQLLTKQGHFNFSTATIRNELNELEKEGYLKHLHTSSGRVPTDKGYRFYVDELIKTQQVTPEQMRFIQHQISSVSLTIHDVLQEVSAVLSSTLNYTTIILTPELVRETLKLAHLILVDIDKVLVILLDSLGINTEFVLQIQHKLNQDDLNKISQLLTRKLSGKSMQSLEDQELISEIIRELPTFKDLLSNLCLEIKKVAAETRNNQRKVLTTGTAKMLTLPEFQDVQLAHKVLSTLEENNVLLALLCEFLQQNTANNDAQQIMIGSENKLENLKECSLVLAPYKFNETCIGAVGILGPKRMTYASILPILRSVSNMISQYLTKK